MAQPVGASVEKSVNNSVPRRPGRNGGSLRNGSAKGNTPGTGRPPNQFKHALRLLRDNPKLHKALETAATDPESKGFNAALKVLTDYDDDKPAEKHTIVGPVEVRVRFVRETRKRTAS